MRVLIETCSRQLIRDASAARAELLAVGIANGTLLHNQIAIHAVVVVIAITRIRVLLRHTAPAQPTHIGAGCCSCGSAGSAARDAGSAAVAVSVASTRIIPIAGVAQVAQILAVAELGAVLVAVDQAVIAAGTRIVDVGAGLDAIAFREIIGCDEPNAAQPQGNDQRSDVNA